MKVRLINYGIDNCVAIDDKIICTDEFDAMGDIAERLASVLGVKVEGTEIPYEHPDLPEDWCYDDLLQWTIFAEGEK